MSLGVKSENVAAHGPGTVIERVLQGKNASAIGHGNGNDHEAALNLQTGFQSYDCFKLFHCLIVFSVTVVPESGI